MNNSEMKRVSVGATIFAAVSIALMLQRAATKHIMITDAAGTPRDRGEITNSYTLLVDEALPQGKENLLIIPLPETVPDKDYALTFLRDSVVGRTQCGHIHLVADAPEVRDDLLFHHTPQH